MGQPEGHMISIINKLSVNRSLKVVVVGGGGVYVGGWQILESCASPVH